LFSSHTRGRQGDSHGHQDGHHLGTRRINADENGQKPWENHGKTMGKPWENHGKTMGKPWENGDLTLEIGAL